MKRNQFITKKNIPRVKFKSPLEDMKTPEERRAFMETIMLMMENKTISVQSGMELIGINSEEI